MEASHQLILLGSALVLLSIFAGLFSARFGAPLLLVFLGLGMLAGEEGPGGIVFHDFRAAYLIGSIALAIILFVTVFGAANIYVKVLNRVKQR